MDHQEAIQSIITRGLESGLNAEIILRLVLRYVCTHDVAVTNVAISGGTITIRL